MFDGARKRRQQKQARKRVRKLLGDDRQVERNMRVNGIKPSDPDYGRTERGDKRR